MLTVFLSDTILASVIKSEHFKNGRFVSGTRSFNSGRFLLTNKHCIPNKFDHSDALFTLRLSILILNYQCEEGAREFSNIWYIMITISCLLTWWSNALKNLRRASNALEAFENSNSCWNKSRKPWKQLKSVLIDSNHSLVHSESVLFDDLGFNTTDGFINEGDGIITAPTIMFVSAIDKLFEKIDSRLLNRVRSGGFSYWYLLLIGWYFWFAESSDWR